MPVEKEPKKPRWGKKHGQTKWNVGFDATKLQKKRFCFGFIDFSFRSILSLLSFVYSPPNLFMCTTFHWFIRAAMKCLIGFVGHILLVECSSKQNHKERARISMMHESSKAFLRKISQRKNCDEFGEREGERDRMKSARREAIEGKNKKSCGYDVLWCRRQTLEKHRWHFGASLEMDKNNDKLDTNPNEFIRCVAHRFQFIPTM